MEYTNFTGKTVEDAITNASVALGVTSDEIEYVVVDKGSSGFLGIGSKDAVIRVQIGDEEAEQKGGVSSAKEASGGKEAAPEREAENESDAHNGVDDSEAEQAAQIAGEFLAQVFAAMNLDVTIDCEYDQTENTMNVDLSGPHMGVVIGKHGATLDAVQYLTNLVTNKRLDSYIRVKVDTENYRERRTQTLERLASSVASRVRRTGQAEDLEPMNAYERRIIHTALQQEDGVTTHSEGEDPYRYVVVEPAE